MCNNYIYIPIYVRLRSCTLIIVTICKLQVYNFLYTSDIYSLMMANLQSKHVAAIYNCYSKVEH